MAIWGTTLDRCRGRQRSTPSMRAQATSPGTQVLKAGLRANASSGPIIANGKVITGRQCQPDATSDSCIITAHDAQTGKEVWRTRTNPASGRAGFRDLGRCAAEQRWRRHVDGAELRPRDQHDLRRHVGDDPGAEVHARR